MRDPKRSIYGKKGLRLEGITHGSRYFPGKVHYCADLDVKNKGGEVTMLMIRCLVFRRQRTYIVHLDGNKLRQL